jgi:hypothetical protein
MAKKSTLVGFIGLVIGGMGILLAAGGLSSLALSVIIGFLGINLSWIAPLGLLNVAIGIAMAWVGMKLYFDNETALTKMLIGVAGIGIVILAVLLAIACIATADIIGVFAFLILVSMGVAFIQYGFSIHILKPMDRLMALFKKMVAK